MADALHLRRDETTRKAGLVAQLASFLGRREHVAAVEPRLTRRQWQALAYRRLRDGPVPLGSLQVRLRAQGATPAQAVAELAGLLTTGCLLVVDQPPMKEKLDPTPANLGDGRYADLRVTTFPALLDVAERLSAGVDVLGWAAPPPVRTRPGGFVDVQREAYLGLRAAAEGQIRLTARGVPFKADATRLAASAAGRPPRGKGPRKKGDQVQISPRLWFVLAVLMASDLTEEQEARLGATAAAQEFLRSPAAHQARQLYAGWLDCVFSEFFRIPALDLAYPVDRDFAWVDPTVQAYGVSDTPTWPRLRQARRAVAEAIRQAASGRAGDWLSIRSLSTTIRADDPEFLVPARPPAYGYSSYHYGTRRPRYYEGIRRKSQRYPNNQLRREEDWEEVEGAYVAQVLAEPLFWLGLVDLGEDADGKLASFRLTAIGRHVLLGEALPDDGRPPANGPALVVQPNFDLVVLDASANLGLLAQLDDFAERSTLDRAATYRLTRESVVRGLERGHTGQSILSLLEGASRAPVPQNVRYSVEEWNRLFERIHVRRGASLLVADSPRQASAWLEDTGLAAALGRRLSPTAYLVPSERRATVESLLSRQGPAPRSVDYAQPRRRLFRVSEPASVEVLPRHDEPYVRYRLAGFADPAPSADQRVRFEITPQSVRRASAAGVTANGILSYLRECAAGEVPADTILRVKGWAGAYGAIRYQPTVSVEAPPGLSWADLQVVPAVREGIVRLLGPTIALVDPERFEAMRSALTERGLTLEPGLSAQPQAGPAGAPAGAGVAGRLRWGIEALARRLFGDQPDPDEPCTVEVLRELSDLAPGLLKQVSLRVLEPAALRAFLLQAAQQKRQVLVGVEAPDGTGIALPLKPTRVWREGPEYYVDALCDNCDELHTISLDEITGVAEVEQGRDGSQPR